MVMDRVDWELFTDLQLCCSGFIFKVLRSTFLLIPSSEEAGRSKVRGHRERRRWLKWLEVSTEPARGAGGGAVGSITRH